MNKYQRQVPSTTIDIYDVLKAWGVTCPATQHAIKKLLQPGERGHKDKLTDLREALASIERAIEIEKASHGVQWQWTNYRYPYSSVMQCSAYFVNGEYQWQS